MADLTTPNKALTLPTPGVDVGVWGGIINTDLGLIDTALGGTLFLSITGNTILTSAQTQNTGFEFTGALTSGSTVTWPAYSGFVAVRNGTTGGFSITCGVSGGGASVSVTSGAISPIWCDGINFYQLTQFTGGAATTGSGPLVLQTTPQIITPNVSGFITLQGAMSGASVLTAPVSGGGTITFPPGTRTLADTLLDNVTLTGDATNVGTAITVSNLSHVNNNSLATAGLVSGYVILGATTMNLGSTTSGISGLTAINSTLVSGTSGQFATMTTTTLNNTSPEGSIFQSSLPFIVAPSGTMAASGKVTLGTALPVTYLNAYAYFPNGAIQSGSLAGWYFTQFTSAVSGTVYNNTYSAGQPTVPGSFTAFVSAGPGAYTGVVTQQTAYSFTVSGVIMTGRSTLRLVAATSVPATSGTKTIGVTYGGTAFSSYAENISGATSIILTQDISNQETVSGQFSIWTATAGVSGSAVQGIGTARGTVSTSGNQTFLFSLQKGLAADYIVLEHMTVELVNGP